MAADIIHLSGIVHSPLLGSDGERMGRVEDVIARQGEQAHPPVTGIVARIGRRELFVPIAMIADVRPGCVQLQGETLNLARFERRPGELLLTKDLSGRHLINIVGARLIRANEIEIAPVDGTLEVIGVDPTSRPVLRRMLPRMLAQRIPAKAVVDWESIQPFVSHVPTAMLRIPYRKLARLHPAQIADLVEAASHEEGEEIIEAVGQDRELEADVFEELDDEHQLEFLDQRSDREVAAVLSRMASDDAADLLLEIKQERRLPVLDLMPLAKQRKIKGLLGYNPSTAGGVMSPDFVAVPREATVASAIAAARSQDIAADSLAVILLTDASGQLSGVVSAGALIRASPEQTLDSLAEGSAPSVGAESEIPEVARLMTDYNLIALPVVDSEGRPIGVVSVDDILELTLPEQWRRRYGLARE